MDIGKKLKAARTAAGLTQEQAAERLGDLAARHLRGQGDSEADAEKYRESVTARSGMRIANRPSK